MIDKESTKFKRWSRISMAMSSEMPNLQKDNPELVRQGKQELGAGVPRRKSNFEAPSEYYLA